MMTVYKNKKNLLPYCQNIFILYSSYRQFNFPQNIYYNSVFELNHQVISEKPFILILIFFISFFFVSLHISWHSCP